MSSARACWIGRDVQTLFQAGSFAGLSDGQLLERFNGCRGEVAERPSETLVERHGPMILRTCQRILRNDQDAQDAFQATFLILLRKSRSLWVRESLGPWLHRIACRAAIRARTAQVRRQTVLQELTALVDGPAPSAPSHELVGVIHEEIDRLPDHYRAAIVLCDLEGHTCEQTAQLLGCPLGTVGSRLARGREKLRGRLIRRGMAPAAGTVAAALSHDALGSIPTPLVEMTLRAAMGNPAPSATGRRFHRSREDYPRDLQESVHGQVSSNRSRHPDCRLASACYPCCLTGPPRVRNPLATQAVEKAQEKLKKPADQNTVGGLVATDFGNDPVRYKDYLIATIGNSLFNRDQEKTVPVNRMAILYRDGTAKLWSFDSKDPVCPPLRDTTPIREIAFQQNAGILVTAAETSVKIWNGVTGELLKEMPGQVLRPLAFVADFIARRTLRHHRHSRPDGHDLEQQLAGSGRSLPTGGRRVEAFDRCQSVTRRRDTDDRRRGSQRFLVRRGHEAMLRDLPPSVAALRQRLSRRRMPSLQAAGTPDQ